MVSAFGMAAGILALLPGALIVGQGLAARMMYTPLVGFSIALGGLVAAGVSLFGPRTRRRLAAALAPVVIAGACAGAVTMMGLQKAYQLRTREDQAIMAQLMRLVPEPPPQTIFLPVRLEHWPTRTGMIRFDRLRPGVFETIWSATAIVRQSYRRIEQSPGVCRSVCLRASHSFAHVPIRSDRVGSRGSTGFAGATRMGWRDQRASGARVSV